MATRAQTIETEKKAIEAFREKLETLCKEYEIQAVCIATRKETEKFEDEPTASVCAAFIAWSLNDPNMREAEAMEEAYQGSKEVFENIKKRALLFQFKKELDEAAKKEVAEKEAAETTTPFQDENGAK